MKYEPENQEPETNQLNKLLEENSDVIAQFESENTLLSAMMAGSAASMEEADEEDEMYWYQGDHLDLAPMLREQVILAAPMQPLCREECLGLCSQCGQNLNERRCGCPPEQAPSPFRVLRGRQSQSGNA